MKATFLYDPHYFECCVPDSIEGWEVEKVHIDHKRLDTLIGLSSDVWILIRCDLIQNVISTLKGKKIFVSTEPIERSDVIPSLKRVMDIVKFDLVTHYDVTHLRTLDRLGIHIDQVFQLPVNMNVCRPQLNFLQPSMRFSKYGHDLMFVGRSTHHREYMLSNLKRDYDFLHVAHGFNDEIIAIHSATTFINLNVHIDSFMQLQHRMQNLLAGGAFILSEELTHDYQLKSPDHFIQFKGRTDLHEKVDYYLTHSEERLKIAKHGQQYVINNFNAEKNWLTLLKQIA